MKKIIENICNNLTPKERRKFLTLSVFDICISLIDIFSLAALLWIIQFYLSPGDNDSLALPQWLTNRNSIALIAVFLIFFIVKNIAGLLVSRNQSRFISKIAIRISQNHLKGYQQTDYNDYVQTDSSHHIRTIAIQPFEFCQHMLTGAFQIVTQLFLVSMTIIAILLFNTQIFLLLLAILLPPAVVVFLIIKRKMIKVKKELHASNQLSVQYLLDALKGWIEGNIFNRNSFFLNRFIDQRQKFGHHIFYSLWLQNVPSRIIEIFAIIGLFILIAISPAGGTSQGYGFITIGAFVAAAYKIIPGVVRIINTAGQMKAFEFTFSDNFQDTEKPAADSARISSLELKKVNFSYSDRPILKDFSCNIKKGEFIGVAGPSGRGKTTLFNIALGFLNYQNGSLLFNEQKKQNGSVKNCWPHITYVKQQPFLIHDTLIRNITLEEKVTDPMALDEALKITGLHDLIAASPEGYDKIITENGKNISGGQQQRIAIARALYKKDADLILLDEPFNELDESSVKSILGHLQIISRNGKMILLITHDEKYLSYCDKIISLDEQPG